MLKDPRAREAKEATEESIRKSITNFDRILLSLSLLAAGFSLLTLTFRIASRERGWGIDAIVLLSVIGTSALIILAPLYRKKKWLNPESYYYYDYYDGAVRAISIQDNDILAIYLPDGVSRWQTETIMEAATELMEALGYKRQPEVPEGGDA